MEKLSFEVGSVIRKNDKHREHLIWIIDADEINLTFRTYTIWPNSDYVPEHVNNVCFVYHGHYAYTNDTEDKTTDIINFNMKYKNYFPISIEEKESYKQYYFFFPSPEDYSIESFWSFDLGCGIQFHFIKITGIDYNKLDVIEFGIDAKKEITEWVNDEHTISKGAFAYKCRNYIKLTDEEAADLT